MIKSLLIVAVVLCTGCADGKRQSTAKDEMNITCLDGVNYYLIREARRYQGYGYMAPKFKRDGSLSLCGAE